MIMSQLDIRTIRSQQISSKEMPQALIHYVEAYADFGMQCAKYKHKTIVKYEAENAEENGADADETVEVTKKKNKV